MDQATFAFDDEEVEPAASPDRYEPLELLGKGGMGEVWRVYDAQLDRSVAMKIIGERIAGRSRFVLEARATAKLQHPGIVPIHDLGELADGRLYYTMEEVKGQTLLDAISAGAWTSLRLVDVLKDVCEAVAFAHARELLHRDLKPENILLGEHGAVRVVDWGLVKVMGEASGARIVAGTPGFMSPEQASGAVDELTPASDVWSLGAILYCILFGEVRSGGPAAIERNSSSGVSHALAALCDRAMAASPADRFADAGALAAAMTDWLEGARAEERSQRRASLAEAVFSALTADVQREVTALILALVDPDGLPVARPEEAVRKHGLDTFVSAGIVVSSDGWVSLADAELPGTWDRVALWRDAEGEHHRLRHHLIDQVRAWTEADRSGALLAKGERLADLSAWRRVRRPLLTDTEVDFLDASVVADRSQRRIRTTGMLAVIAVLAVSTLVSATQWRSAQISLEAEALARAQERTERLRAEGRQLASETSRMLQLNRDHAAMALLSARQSLDPDLASCIDVVGHPQGCDGRLDQLSSSLGELRIIVPPERSLTITGSAQWTALSRAAEFDLYDWKTGEFLGNHAQYTLTSASRDGRWLFAYNEQTYEIDAFLDGDSPAAHSWAVQRVPDTLRSAPRGIVVEAEGGVAYWDPTQDGPVTFTDIDGEVVGNYGTAFLLTWERERLVVRPVDDLEGTGRSVPIKGDFNAVVSGDGRYVAARTPRQLRVYDLDQKEWVIQVPADRAVALHTVFDGELMIAIGSLGRARVFSLPSGVEKWSRLIHDDEMPHVSLATNSRFAVAGDLSGGAHLWDPTNGGVTARLSFDLHDPVTPFFASDSSVIFRTWYGLNGAWRPRLMDAERLAACSRPIFECGFLDPHGGRILRRGADGFLMTNQFTGERSTLPDGLPIFPKDPGQMAVINSRQFGLFEAGVDDPVLVVPFSEERPASTAGLLPGGDGVFRVVDGDLQAWANDGTPLWMVQLREVSETSWELHNPGGRYLAHSHSRTGDLRVFDLGDGGALVHKLPPGSTYSILRAFALHEATGQLAVGKGDGTAEIWRLGAEFPEKTIGSGLSVTATAFAPDGKTVALAHEDGALEVFGEEGFHVRMDGLTPRPWMLHFGPRGERLALVADYSEAQVWDVATGKRLLSVRRGTRGDLVSAQLMEDGSLVTIGIGGVVRWDIPETPQNPLELTNLRVCRDGFEVVPVVPWPDAAAGPWASKEACGAQAAEVD